MKACVAGGGSGSGLWRDWRGDSPHPILPFVVSFPFLNLPTSAFALFVWQNLHLLTYLGPTTAWLFFAFCILLQHSTLIFLLEVLLTLPLLSLPPPTCLRELGPFTSIYFLLNCYLPIWGKWSEKWMYRAKLQFRISLNGITRYNVVKYSGRATR